MKINFLKQKKKIEDDGFTVLKKVLQRRLVNELIQEILVSKKTVKYYDNKGIHRRTEKLYDKGYRLISLNKKIITILKKIFNKDFIIFKDKFNSKPPGGEGFFAHYDGIFNFIDNKNNKRNGWYEYGDCFINVLVALDKCNKQNGALELAKEHKGNFVDLLKNTKQDGTPAIKKNIVSKLKFNLINLNVGDIVIFSNKCPHRSKKNNSKHSRKILYYTYSLKKYGSKYKVYYKDKNLSKNKSKVLSKI